MFAHGSGRIEPAVLDESSVCTEMGRAKELSDLTNSWAGCRMLRPDASLAEVLALLSQQGKETLATVVISLVEEGQIDMSSTSFSGLRWRLLKEVSMYEEIFSRLDTGSP